MAMLLVRVPQRNSIHLHIVKELFQVIMRLRTPNTFNQDVGHQGKALVHFQAELKNQRTRRADCVCSNRKVTRLKTQ